MLELTDEMTRAINNSYADGKVVEVVTAATDGWPDVSFAGSAMAWDKDHLAFWERSFGKTYSNLQENPKVCLFYRNFEGRQVWKFLGEAQIADSGELRQQVMDRTIEAELNHDPERKGVGIIIRVDKVMRGGETLMER
ncbi:MAG: pyridoxamine 5'-phosphate oxidase family protein [Tepidiformaceae bacterium]